MSRQRRSSPLETLDVTSLVLRCCGAGVWVPWCGDTKVPRLEYALELMFCMPSQHHAIGLQTGCMVTMPAPMVEAARLPRVCPMALGYGLPPCNNNVDCGVNYVYGMVRLVPYFQVGSFLCSMTTQNRLR